MTDNEIIKQYESVIQVKSGYIWQDVLGLLKRLRAGNDDLFFKLNGVMHSVDKWLEGEELKQDEVNRAATMREKTLRIVEEQQAEIERYKGVIKILEKDVKTTKSEAIKEFAEKLKTRIKNAVFCCYDVRFKNHLQELLRIIVAMIDNLVKEMTEQ